jgi:hypothetical protein
MVHRKLSLLISTEANRVGCTGIQEGHVGEYDYLARYVPNRTKLYHAHCAVDCLPATRIRNESYEVRSASLKQKTWKQT